MAHIDGRIVNVVTFFLLSFNPTVLVPLGLW